MFASFQQHDVHYVVIGGIAAVLHGVPRATFDLDILTEPTPQNVRQMLDALLSANLATASMTAVEEVLANEITIFRDRVRIDVQTSTPGLVFADAWQHRETMNYDGQDFFVVCKTDLIRPETWSCGAACPDSMTSSWDSYWPQNLWVIESLRRFILRKRVNMSGGS